MTKKKKLVLILSIIFICLLIATFVLDSINKTNIGGKEKRNYSDEIYISLTYGGGEMDGYCYSSNIVLYNDGKVEMYYLDELKGYTYIKDMDALKASINRDKLYYHHVFLSDGCDGSVEYIYLYDPDGTEHAYGGYMVTDDLFRAYQDCIYDAIDENWIKTTREEAVQEYLDSKYSDYY